MPSQIKNLKNVQNYFSSDFFRPFRRCKSDFLVDTGYRQIQIDSGRTIYIYMQIERYTDMTRSCQDLITEKIEDNNV